eukprot:4802303-Amphidinium_carterae.1
MAMMSERDEVEMHQSMPRGRAVVLEGKRIMLFKAMLEEAQSPDGEIAAVLRDGIPLVGELSRSGYFPQTPRTAASSTDDLSKMDPQLRSTVIEATGPSGDFELDAAIATGTDEEVSRGWLRGPLLHSEVCDEFGESWICNRRFAIRQGGKIRLIDDFTISRVNTGVSHAEKIELQGVDCLLAACRYWHRRQGSEEQS